MYAWQREKNGKRAEARKSAQAKGQEVEMGP